MKSIHTKTNEKITKKSELDGFQLGFEYDKSITQIRSHTRKRSQ